MYKYNIDYYKGIKKKSFKKTKKKYLIKNSVLKKTSQKNILNKPRKKNTNN